MGRFALGRGNPGLPPGTTDTTDARINYKTTLTLGSTELKSGYSTAFIRKQNGSQEHITQTSAIISVTSTTGTADELQVRSERIDFTTPSSPVARIADRSGITIIKLDDTNNFARYESSAFFATSATDNTRTVANIQTQLGTIMELSNLSSSAEARSKLDRSP